MASAIVSLSGYARSGKDEFARTLVTEHGFTRVAFADPLREAAYALDPFIRVEADEVGLLQHLHLGRGLQHHHRLSDVVLLHGWEQAKALRDVRRLLQRLGTEVGRNVLGENVWVEVADRKIRDIDGPVVITDCRFPNELAYVVAQDNGWAVHIERPGVESINRHPSETALDGELFDRHILNDGTLEDLRNEAHLLADDIALMAL